MPLISSCGKYRLLFITLIGYILVAPFMHHDLLGRILYAFLFLLVMIGVSTNIKTPYHGAYIMPILGTLTLITTFFDDMSFQLLLASKAVSLMFFVYAIFLFGRNIFLDYHKDIDRIFGSISVYLLIGISYGIVYAGLQLLVPGSIIYQQSGMILHNSFDNFYFSFITLTTVGFGDIVPANDMARAIVMLEGITGLFYLAILVASLTNVFNAYTSQEK